jgi:hypothetical protein
MAKTKFEIGETEKHTLTVERDHVMKKDLIELDGEKLTDEFTIWPGARKYSFDIGNSEVHKVVVTMGRFSPPEVLVDGKPARGSSA